MLKTNLEMSLITVTKQRRLFLMLFLITLGISFILSIAILRQDKQTILIPAGLDEPVGVSTNHLSIGYLEKMTNFFINNMLDLSASNIAYKKLSVLKHVAPEYQQEVLKRFAEEEKKFKENTLSTIFAPTSIEVNERDLAVLVKGKLESAFAKEGRHSQELIIKLQYKYSSGILELAEFLIGRADEKTSK